VLLFQESGLQVALPDESGFRFADLPAYSSLKGCGISEMDYGWSDDEKAALCLLEVKDYTAPTDLPGHLLAKLIAKGRDCLVLLHSAWSELGERAKALRAELPDPCRHRKQVRMFFVLKRDPAVLKREGLGVMQDKLRAQITAYASLLGLRSMVLLVDHEKASRMGLPVQELS